MEIRNWAILVFVVVLLLLIFNFLRTIFKSDQKHFSQDRIFVDYNSYRKTGNSGPEKSNNYTSPVILQQMELTQKYLHAGRIEFTAQAFDQVMSGVLASIPLPVGDKPINNEAFNRYQNLSSQSIEGLTQARIWFVKRNYQQALLEFTAILQALAPEDLQHRLQVYDSLGECCFFLKNKEGYVENKVSYVKTLRRIKELVRQVYPTSSEERDPDWISSQEASQQLLRIRSQSLSRMESGEEENAIRRAEFDLEVARRISD